MTSRLRTGFFEYRFMGDDPRHSDNRGLHHAVFRELVLDAYAGHGAISGLPERRLLHAAHILPDCGRRGQPVVSNGIAMSVEHTAISISGSMPQAVSTSRVGFWRNRCPTI
jgi:hypothetical protein